MQTNPAKFRIKTTRESPSQAAAPIAFNWNAWDQYLKQQNTDQHATGMFDPLSLSRSKAGSSSSLKGGHPSQLFDNHGNLALLFHSFSHATDISIASYSSSFDRPTTSTAAQDPQIEKLVLKATSFTQVIEILHLIGLGRIADRLLHLRQLRLEEPDESPMSEKSAITFGTFLLDWWPCRLPSISLSTEGMIQAEWHLGARRDLVIRFFENDTVRFVALLEEIIDGTVRRSISGLYPRDELASVLDKIGIRDWVRV